MIGGDDLLETRAKLHVESKLAVLSPVNGLGARTGLHLVGREGSLKEGTGGINLDIGSASRAASSKETHTVDLDFGGSIGVGGSGSKAEKGGEESEKKHFEMLQMEKWVRCLF